MAKLDREEELGGITDEANFLKSLYDMVSYKLIILSLIQNTFELEYMNLRVLTTV